MAQTDTREVSLNSIMRTPGFQQGVNDYTTGKPWPTRQLPREAEWDYERGRLFAAATGQKLVRIKRGRVEPGQIATFAKLLREGTII